MLNLGVCSSRPGCSARVLKYISCSEVTSMEDIPLWANGRVQTPVCARIESGAVMYDSSTSKVTVRQKVLR